MVWCMAAALVLMAGVCTSLLAKAAGWQERTKEAEAIIADLYGDTSPAQAHARLRMYCAKWGKVITSDKNLEERM